MLDYDSCKGHVLLEHSYPKASLIVPTILVDVSLILESTDPVALRRGTWVNVIGYTKHTILHGGNHKPTGTTVTLQAVLLWDAGVIRINDYENILEDQKLAQQQSKALNNKNVRP